MGRGRVDGASFDRLTRRLATATSRRSLIKGVVAGAITAGLGSLGVPGAGAALCRAPGDVCRKGGDCCSQLCGPKDQYGRQRCVCPPGQEACHRTCVDPATAYQSDPKNCGACGNQCPGTRCQLPVCNAGVCGLTPNPTLVGQTCDDRDPCTVNDVCQADGTCKGSPKDCSSVADQCNDGVCQAGTGICVKQPKTNGTTCNDGNACTQTDTCQAGACVGSNPVVCAAPDQCHQPGVCNPQTGACDYAPKTDGTTCDTDNNLCTLDTCQAGVCTAGAAKDCSALNDQCNTGACNTSTGACFKQPKTDGTTCNADNNACTNDTCQAGVCTAGTPKSCTATNGACLINGRCDTASGNCVYDDAPVGTTCAAGDTNCLDGACCPASVACTTINGPVCCPSGQSCSTVDAGGTPIGVCCDTGTTACATFNGTSPELICCTSGQTCQTVDTGGVSPFPLGVCCDTGGTACLTVENFTSPTGFSVVCCPSDAPCRQLDLGSSAPFPVGVCCAGEGCLSFGFSGSTPSASAVCCGSGESCTTVDLSSTPFGSVLSGASVGVCCATGAEACAEFTVSGANFSLTNVCCGSGETCQSVELGGFSASTCCATTPCPVLTLAGGSPSGSVVCCSADTVCSTADLGGTTVGQCCPPGQNVSINPITFEVTCCANPCQVFTGGTPGIVCCDATNQVCAPLTGIPSLPTGLGACCDSGQSACLDPANFSSLSFVCCDNCQTITISGTSADVCCSVNEVPYFTGAGVTCAAADACPVFNGTGITPTTCASGTCSTFTLSGFTVGACCSAGQSAAVDTSGGGAAVICCDNAQVCGTNPPVCCPAGSSCGASGSCTT